MKNSTVMNKFLLKVIIFFVILLNYSILIAQNIELDWANAMGGISDDKGRAITTDATGNIYITGSFYETADFDPSATTYNLISAGNNDIFIQKLDASGNLLWAKAMGGAYWDTGISVTTDATGNIYTTGCFSSAVDFDPSGSTNYLISAGGYDIFIQKLDASGNFVWAQAIGGSSDDMSYSITTDASGNIYTTGRFTGTVDFDPSSATYNLTSAGDNDIFIQKLDASGNFVWAKVMGGDGWDEGFSITTDVIGNIYITGAFFDTVDFDPTASIYNLTSAGYADIFIQKLDASGNFIWAKRMGGSDNDYSLSITTDAAGNIYTTGWFAQIADFDPSTGNYYLSSAGYSDIFIQKLDASGNFVWAKAIGGTSSDSGHSITTDTAGNIYTTGFFRGTADFDPSTATLNLTSAGNYDIFIQKLDAFGNFVWVKAMGGTADDEGNSITIDTTGNIYITGYFCETVDFDPSAGTSNHTSAGWGDIFVAKYTPLPEINIVGNGIAINDDDMTPSLTDHTNFGYVNTSSNLVRTYTIENTGLGVLNLTNSPRITVSGTNFSLSSDAPATINPGTSASFEVTFNPTNCDSYSGTISIANNDSDENPYNFAIAGTSDNLPPVPDETTLTDITAECEVISLTAPTATDNCTGLVTGIHNATLPITTQGTTLVTWTYDDGSGNISSQTQNVVIDDQTNPTITCVVNQTVDANATHTYTVSGTEFNPTTTDDNCGVVSIDNSFNNTETLAGTALPEGTTNIVWTVTDIAGNTSTCSFDVIINTFSGIETLQQSGISFYPNPTNGIVNFNFTDNHIQKLTISDIIGKQIFEKTEIQKNEQIDLSGFVSGIYIINIQTDNEIFTTEIIKE